jgi:calcineurin-like phosphoesterase family protein
MSVLFCSDLHLGHALAAKLRGYDSVEKHDQDVIYKLMQQCTKRTLLWILGDVAMKRESLDLLNAVYCEKRLVRGNHDNFQLGVYLKYFQEIHGFLRYKEMWLSHCPIHPQEMCRVKLNVHGHIHKGAMTPELPLPYFNVNWDFWGRAVSLDEIIKVRDEYHARNSGEVSKTVG